MDDSETYINVHLVKPESRSSSRNRQTSNDRKLNIGKDESEDPPIASGPGELRVTAQTGRQTSTYKKLNIGKDESEYPPIASGPGELRVTAQTGRQTSTYKKLNIGKDDSEDPPIASGPGELRVTTQTAAHEQQSKVKIGNRPYRLICLLCLVTSALIVIVVGLSIHVSQMRQSLKRMHSDLRQQFTEMETKYRSVNETKAQICELLTSRREEAFSQEWIRNEDGCYFISTFNYYYDEAKKYCSNSNSKLLEINSAEAIFFSKTLHDQVSSYWIGECKDGKVASNVMFRLSGGDPECGVCTWYSESKPCDEVRTRFICEKSAPLCPDISEKIQDLCQQPLGPP